MTWFADACRDLTFVPKAIHSFTGMAIESKGLEIREESTSTEEEEEERTEDRPRVLVAA